MTACGAVNSKAQPSPYWPPTRPELRKPTCPCMQSSVPTTGFMWVDQRNPGGYTTRLTWPLAAATTSILTPPTSWCRAFLIGRSLVAPPLAGLGVLAAGAFRCFAFALRPPARFFIEVPSWLHSCRARAAGVLEDVRTPSGLLGPSARSGFARRLREE